MEKWKEFEIECCDYLNDKYGGGCYKFIRIGASDSTASDIAFYKFDHHMFNIEVKMPQAQSGQFVVLDNNGTFVFSCLNKSDENDAKIFIDHMNANYELFKNVKKKSIPIKLSKDELTKWIIKHYNNKDTLFVISKSNEDFVIIPLSEYGNYFDVSAVYRIKKSGSANPTEKNKLELENWCSINNVKCNFYFENKKLYATYLPLNKKEKITIGEYDYMVSDINEKGYKITRLSNTYNANVIFSIKLIKSQNFEDLEYFKEQVK